MTIIATLKMAAGFRASGSGSIFADAPDLDVDLEWTTFTATEPSGEGSSFVGAGTRKIYVSNSTGNDSNAGTLASPKLTLSGGVALLRANKPDWLLLKKGDTWTNQVFGTISTDGVSASEPMLISAYGSGARPLIKSRPADGMSVIGIGNPTFIAVVGLEFYAYTRDPGNPSYNAATTEDQHDGLFWSGTATTGWVLIEDCKIHFYQVNVVQATAQAGTFAMRRCIICDQWCPDTVGHGAGLFIDRPASMTFFQNWWDHNGWNETGVDGGPNALNRNLYIEQKSGPATVTGDMYLRSSAEGMQLRSSGSTMTDCFFYDNPIGFDVGHQQSDEPNGPYTGIVTNDNVIMKCGDINDDPVNSPRGMGITVQFSTGATINNNIITQYASGQIFGWAVRFDGDTSGCTFNNNITFNWSTENNSTQGILNSGTGNDVTPNDFDAAGTNANPGGTAPNEPFPVPTRTLAGYAAAIGLTGTDAAFYTAVRAQSRDNWNAALLAPAVNDYIRAGFGRPYDNLTNWPSITNRPTFSGSTLSWIGPVGGGASTSSDVLQTQVLTNSGSVSSSSNGQTIQNLNISGDITIGHNNVTVKRCRVNDTHSNSGLIHITSGTGIVIEDCEINGGGSSSYGILNRSGGSGAMHRRCNIHGFENGIDPGNSDTVRDCYIWGMANSDNGSPHYDNIEFDGGNNLLVEHNQCENTQEQNACINIDNFFDPLTNVTINNNRCIGANYTIWLDASFGGGSVSNITITNNLLGIGDGGYFAFTSFTPTHTGNKDYLTLASVD